MTRILCGLPGVNTRLSVIRSYRFNDPTTRIISITEGASTRMLAIVGPIAVELQFYRRRTEDPFGDV